MSYYRAAGYRTMPPEFHADVFARLLVRPGALQAVATSQNPLHTRKQLVMKPLGLLQENGTEGSICVWAQVLVHMNPCVDVSMVCLISWYYYFFFVLAVDSLLAWRLKD